LWMILPSLPPTFDQALKEDGADSSLRTFSERHRYGYSYPAVNAIMIEAHPH
jgi:hypothetical protein